MVLLGRVKDNVIEIDNKKVKLPNGTKVEIIPLHNNTETDNICGSWDDNRDAEKIIKDIKKSRQNRKTDLNT